MCQLNTQETNRTAEGGEKTPQIRPWHQVSPLYSDQGALNWRKNANDQ